MMLFKKRREKNMEAGQQAPLKTAEELAAEKQAAKEAAKEKAIEEYRAKRDLTVGRFFEILEMDMPAHLQHLAGKKVENITADIRRLGPDDIYFFWAMPSLSRYVEHPLKMAAEIKPLLIVTDDETDYADTLHIENAGPEHDGIRDLYIKALHHIRSIHKAKIIGVTGSIGKTSTKEMIESVLRHHYKRPMVSEGNNNSFYAIGRNIQSLKRTTNVYLQEVGAASPRVVEFSARQLACNMVVYTNISTPHLDQYGSVENILKDKASLSDFGAEDGLAIINFDEPLLMAYPFRQKKITYSLKNPGAMYFAKDIQPTADGFTFKICSSQGHGPAGDGTASETAAQVHALGEHNVLNAMAAWAVGKALNLPEEEILAGICDYRPSGMRQNLMEACGFKVFADCYNSNQVAIEGSLKAMDQMLLPEGGRRIAVLGDVLSLGERSEEIHREIGRTIKDHKVDKLICYGNDMRFACEEAAADGVDALFFSDRNRPGMEAEIRRILCSEDVILFKASHVVNLGSTMDRLFGTDINESISIGHHQFRLVEEGQFEFYAFADGASVKTYLGETDTVVIPDHIEAVILDEFFQFQGLEGNVKRTLAVEKIGKTAFRDKTHVRHVQLPSTLIRIRDGAFKGSGIEELRLPDGTLSIGSQAFASCENLKELFIPDSVKEFGEDILAESPQAVICCSRGSAADAWAQNCGYPVNYL